VSVLSKATKGRDALLFGFLIAAPTQLRKDCFMKKLFVFLSLILAFYAASPVVWAADKAGCHD